MEYYAAKPGSTSDTDIDITFVDSSGESYGDSYYVELHKKLPARLANTPDLARHIKN